MRLRNIFTKVLVFLILLGGSAFLYANIIILQYKPGIYADLSAVPRAPIALVFGGGMKEDGEQTDYQFDRVRAAIELYKSGKVGKIMMTGDDGRRRADEVGAMKKQAMDIGIPDTDIVIDPAGLRTYESCYRAKSIYGLTDIIAVSQDFHLPRILYFCSRQGIHVVGFSADRREYDTIFHLQVREALARLKGWWQQEVTKPKPKYLGEKIQVL